jgi:ribosomal protein S18 acetylase RimI-like enzyme
MAVPDDWRELARLRWDFRLEHGTPASTTFERFAEEFQGFAEEALAGSWRVWVADDGAALVGCVWLQLVEKVPHPSRGRWQRPLGYVTNMYVAPEQRNAGIGRRLLDEALGFASERGVDGVVVWPTDRSIPFYRRAGFDAAGAPLWLTSAGD